MSATVQQVIDPCRVASRDPSGAQAFVSDAEYVTLVDNRQRDAIALLPDESARELQQDTTINTVAAVAGFPFGNAVLPANFWMLRAALLKQSATGNFYLASIKRFEAFWGDLRPEQTIRANEKSPEIAIVGGNAYIAPCPVSVTGGLRLLWVIEPTRLTVVANTLQVNGTLQGVIVNMVLFDVFNKMGRADQAMAYLNLAGQQVVALGGRWNDREMMAPPQERRQ